jgi:hypothetical protein
MTRKFNVEILRGKDLPLRLTLRDVNGLSLEGYSARLLLRREKTVLLELTESPSVLVDGDANEVIIDPPAELTKNLPSQFEYDFELKSPENVIMRLLTGTVTIVEPKKRAF